MTNFAVSNILFVNEQR